MMRALSSRLPDAGFSLIEVLVSGALVSFALTCSIFLLIETGHARLRLSERKSITSVLDASINDLRASTAYEGEAQKTILAHLPQKFSLNVNGVHGQTECTSTSTPEDPASITFRCASQSGVHVTRLVILSGSAPVPGTILDPAPSDIIRLRVSTPKPDSL